MWLWKCPSPDCTGFTEERLTDHYGLQKPFLCPKHQKPMTGEIYYGQPLCGVWVCPNAECSFSCFPRHLKDKKAQPPFKCPNCQTELDYDEEQ